MKKINFRLQFKEATSYNIESRSYIYFIRGLFFISAILGFIFADKLTFLNEMLKELVEKTQNMGFLDITFFILQNNVQVSFFSVILGSLLGIFPIINSISNGFILGYVFNLLLQNSGINDFWRILPHGIFELPAVFISLGLGLKLGAYFLTNKREKFFHRLYKSLNSFLFVVVPLLIIAAIIEGVLIIFTK